MCVETGPKPQLAWEPVAGAARYMLVVYAASGETYWAWEGGSTSVYMGGSSEQPRADSAGPVIHEGMTWGVVGFDADGMLIGSSVRAPIAP